jgi:hemolysin III
MSNHHEGEAKHFSPTLFIITNTINLIGIILTLWLILPESVWVTQWKSSWLKFAIVFVGMSMFNCFLEYFFHRYVLHKSALGFLSYFYKSHTKHHNLTRIGKRKNSSGKEVPYIIEIENKYPITEPEQDESSFFPWYSFPVFVGVVMPLFILLHLVAPPFPWFFAGTLSILSSLTLYEFVHAIEHWPIERWDKLNEHPRFGPFFRKVYSFHLRHHAVIDCNEAISGWFTLPLADWVFGTFILPKTLYIRLLDKLADESIQKRRAKARL